MAKYLCGYEKAIILGIAHEQYIRHTENTLNGSYDINNTTKYMSKLLKHPKNEEYCLEIDNTSGLESKHVKELKEKSVLETDGWFELKDDEYE
jgi:hypothetical protein